MTPSAASPPPPGIALSDFLVALADGSRRLIETKGQENLDVAFKDRAAALWCEKRDPAYRGGVAVSQGAAARVRRAPAVELRLPGGFRGRGGLGRVT